MPSRHAARCATVALSLLASASLPALELPQRKVGLWETSFSSSLHPGVTARSQECLGPDTEHEAVARAEAQMLKMGCPKVEPQKLGSAYTYDSACKIGGSTMKTHGEVTYTSDALVHSVSTVDRGDGKPAFTNTSDARWLGPCKPGQKPGDHELMNADELRKH